MVQTLPDLVNSLTLRFDSELKSYNMYRSITLRQEFDKNKLTFKEDNIIIVMY